MTSWAFSSKWVKRFRIARSRTVWVTVMFKAWFLNVSHLVFFIACEIYFLSVLSKRSIRSKERASWTWLQEINTVLKMAVFGKSCWNVDTWKMLLSVLKRYFFGFIKALASKGILNTLKNELHQPWRALTLQLLLSLRDKWDRSLCKFISPEATVMNVFAMNIANSSCGFGHLKRIFWLFFRSELWVLKKN